MPCRSLSNRFVAAGFKLQSPCFLDDHGLRTFNNAAAQPRAQVATLDRPAWTASTNRLGLHVYESSAFANRLSALQPPQGANGMHQAIAPGHLSHRRKARSPIHSPAKSHVTAYFFLALWPRPNSLPVLPSCLSQAAIVRIPPRRSMSMTSS